MGQAPAVGLYQLTGRIAVPLTLSVGAFLGGGLIMLHLAMREQRLSTKSDQLATAEFAPLPATSNLPYAAPPGHAIEANDVTSEITPGEEEHRQSDDGCFKS